MAEDNSYPAPATPLSFREVLAKALDDPEYAAFIHAEVLRAREAGTEGERADALANIDAHFMLSDEELTAVGLAPGGRPACGHCTDTNPTLFLLDFATKTPSWPPEEANP